MPGPGPPRFEPIDFDDLEGFGADDHLAAFRCFERSARALVERRPDARTARPPSDGLLAAARSVVGSGVTDGAGARRFFETWFRPHRIVPEPPGAGFLTGYYEPLRPRVARGGGRLLLAYSGAS